MKTFFKLLGICAFLSLVACSTTSPMKVALTELGTSSRSEKVKGGYKAQIAINVTGLAPHEEIGTVSFDPDRFSLVDFLSAFSSNPKDIPDILSPKLNLGNTMVYERTFCGKSTSQNDCATEAHIKEIKDSIDLHDKTIGLLANAEIEQATIRAIQVAINQNEKDTEKYLTFLKQQFPNNTNLATAKTESYTPNLDKAVADLEIKIDTLKTELEELKDKVIKPGIIITNWKLNKSAGVDASVVGLSGSYDSEKDLSGYLILGNPSVHSLHIGKDIIKVKAQYGDAANIFRNKNLYVTFYQVRAKQVLYAESRESTVAIQAKLKLNELISTITTAFSGGANVVSGLQKLDLSLNARYAKYTLSSNQGFLDATKGNTTCAPLISGQTVSNCKDAKSNVVKESVPVVSSRFGLDKYLD